MNTSIMTSRDVMALLQISENTLLKYERIGIIKVDFRLGNRKRYYWSSIEKSLIRLSKRR
ncbi:MerR family transcriptional regulator [Winogradskyella sp. A2]|uniref:MerR family transcriptional regulator n=1 Tax=Winogradskyella sp. A2 TaxID=3366944 RepID=UPI00398C731F